MPATAEPSRPPEGEGSAQVQKRVWLTAVLGILLTSLAIGGTATYLLYNTQAETLKKQLSFAIELQSATLQSELARLSNIASQITSRTRIRQELERYNRGEISRQALLRFTSPKLTDAMDSNPDILGITRLSHDRTPILTVGSEIPAAHWPKKISDHTNRIGPPRGGMLVISAPITNRALETVGIDLVMFRDDRLSAIMRTFFEHIKNMGSAQLVTLVDGRAQHFYDIGHATQPLGHEALKSELIAQLQLGTNEGLHNPGISESGKMIITDGPIGPAGWVLVFHTEQTKFFAPARKQAVYVAFAIILLAFLAIAMTTRIIQPLVNKLSSETRSLQRLLRRNEELLDVVQANEAKLQAVIDNAPAVIYIKDRAGRYLLVNNSYERMLARPREQIIGRFDYEIFPEDIAKSTRDTDLEVLSTGRSLELDEKAPQTDGMHDYLSTKFPLFDSKGDIYAICGIASDITERKHVERRLALTQATVDRANVGILWTDAFGQLIYVNDAALDLLQVNRRDLRHVHLSDISMGFNREDWQNHWQSIEDQGSLHYEMQYQRSDGSDCPVEVYASRLTFGEQKFYIALVHDISARRESERELRQSATVFDCTAEAIVITDSKGTVLDVNAAFCDFLGFAREDVIGENPRIWKSNLHDDAFYDNMWRSISETGEWRGEIVNRSKDGAVTPALATVSTVHNDSGEAIGHVAIYTDVSQIKKSQQQLAHLAHHDALTNLPNRVLFFERLEHCLERAARHNGQVAVIFLDLDHFKHVNDSLGHSYGDRLLIGIAELLTKAVRSEDTVARIGGDEFTVLIEEVLDRGSLIRIIEKILQAFDREFLLGESSVRVTPSLGVSISPDDGQDAEALMRNADAAMYRAKATGRNTYQFYTEELTKLAFARMQMDSALRKAIPQGEFSLLYQPQIDLATGQVIGMEALLRWNNAELGQVPPDQFIPITEDNGLILPLGEWILEEACRCARNWLDQGLLKGTLAVNISGVQVRRGDLAEVISRVLTKTGLPAGHLELEVTESFIMGGFAQAIDVLTELRNLGLTLAIDDFGTGYSSLSYLKSLPIHRLKIDKSFIRDIPQDPNDAAITRAVIALGRSLNLELVAEGVETATQRQFLLDEGCCFGQGYLFHRPLEEAMMQQLLTDGLARQRGRG